MVLACDRASGAGVEVAAYEAEAPASMATAARMAMRRVKPKYPLVWDGKAAGEDP